VRGKRGGGGPASARAGPEENSVGKPEPESPMNVCYLQPACNTSTLHMHMYMCMHMCMHMTCACGYCGL